MPEKSNETGLCREDTEMSLTLYGKLPAVVRELAGKWRQRENLDSTGPIAIPSQDIIVSIIKQTRRILFPGYFTEATITPVNLEYYLGQEIIDLYGKLARQITLCIRYECLRHHRSCSHCQERGFEDAKALIDSLSGLVDLLHADVDAALEGDPAAKSRDEVILSYPGLLAISAYRIANALFRLEVPLMPRIMSEFAHSQTGIDIHPGAAIGDHFFIDHGTGIVIGETTVIGNRVRIYQGVTLGAISLPRDAGERFRNKKRHPTIEDDVIIYANTTILGGETVIGARSIIGGNNWITGSIPPDTKVVLKSPEQIHISREPPTASA